MLSAPLDGPPALGFLCCAPRGAIALEEWQEPFRFGHRQLPTVLVLFRYVPVSRTPFLIGPARQFYRDV